MQALNSILAEHGYHHVIRHHDGMDVISTSAASVLVNWTRYDDASFELRDADIPVVEKCIALISRHAQGDRLLTANVYMQRRVPTDAPAYKHPEWLEYLVVLTYNTGARLTVGVIQRTIGADIECHS